MLAIINNEKRNFVIEILNITCTRKSFSETTKSRTTNIGPRRKTDAAKIPGEKINTNNERPMVI